MLSNIYTLHVCFWKQLITYSIIVSLQIHSWCTTNTSTVKTLRWINWPINQCTEVKEERSQGPHKANQYTCTINNFSNQVSQIQQSVVLPRMKFFIINNFVFVYIHVLHDIPPSTFLTMSVCFSVLSNHYYTHLDQSCWTQACSKIHTRSGIASMS